MTPCGPLDPPRGAAESVGDLGEGGVRLREALALVGEDRHGSGGEARHPVEARQIIHVLEEDLAERQREQAYRRPAQHLAV